MSIRSYFRDKFQKYNFKDTGNGFNIEINYTPLAFKLDRAQFALDGQVMNDMQIYMPEGTTKHLRDSMMSYNAMYQGTGKVAKYNPNLVYARYMYEGIVYVDPVYRIGGFYSPDYGFWSRPGVTKVPSGRKLKYTSPLATDHWDRTAIKNHANQWLEIVKKELNK